MRESRRPRRLAWAGIFALLVSAVGVLVASGASAQTTHCAAGGIGGNGGKGGEDSASGGPGAGGGNGGRGGSSATNTCNQDTNGPATPTLECSGGGRGGSGGNGGETASGTDGIAFTTTGGFAFGSQVTNPDGSNIANSFGYTTGAATPRSEWVQTGDGYVWHYPVTTNLHQLPAGGTCTFNQQCVSLVCSSAGVCQ